MCASIFNKATIKSAIDQLESGVADRLKSISHGYCIVSETVAAEVGNPAKYFARIFGAVELTAYGSTASEAVLKAIEKGESPNGRK